MELFWYVVLILMLTVYVILDGYDFGAGIIHLFFAREERDKQLIKRSIGPFWDANEVWLIAAGGVLFFAFPILYASSFSGFYLPLIMVLWLLIFRAIGLELRGHLNHRIWASIWDVSFGMASLLLALFLGIALGNVVRGVNLGMVENGVSTQEAHYFFLPLWNPTLSPQAVHLGIIDWFTLLLGMISVISLTIHGAGWILLKTNIDIKEKIKHAVFVLNIVLIVLVILSLLVWHLIEKHPLQNFIDHVWLWIFPAITFSGLIGQCWVRRFTHEGRIFLFSSMFLAGGLASTAAAIFPNLLPSTNDVNASLTIHNTATQAYGLSAGMSWFFVALLLVSFYFLVQYRVFKGKMDDVDYGAH